MGRVTLVLLALAWLAFGAWMAFELAPLMLTAGRPELILLAFLVPPVWLIATLFGYIGWASSSWAKDRPEEINADADHHRRISFHHAHA